MSTSAQKNVGRPFVLINMAMTADGKIATANRNVSSFGSKRDQEHLYELRATADAVMCGARTVEAGEIYLGAGGEKFQKLRLKRGLAEFGARIIVSGSGSLNPHAAVFTQRFSPIIIITSERASTNRIKALSAAADEVLVCGKTEVDFTLALVHLRKRWKIKRLLCEGGGELNDALLRAGLVDELNLTVCPKIFGGRTAPTISEGAGFAHLNDAYPLKLKSAKRDGDEMFLVYSRR